MGWHLKGGGASTLTAFEVSWRNQWWVAIKVGGVMEWSMCTKYESLHNFKSSIYNKHNTVYQIVSMSHENYKSIIQSMMGKLINIRVLSVRERALVRTEREEAVPAEGTSAGR